MGNQTIQKPFFRPSERSDTPIVGGQRPGQVFPADNEFPLTVGDPGFTLGTLFVELPGVPDVLVQADVAYPLRNQKTAKQDDIIMGDIDQVTDTMPDYLHVPTDFHRVEARVGPNRQVGLQYRDFAGKHPDLKRPYQVTIIVEFIQTHPAVEALADGALRDRIYADLAMSDYYCMSVDLDRYRQEPTYSAADELRRTDSRYFSLNGEHNPTIEAMLVSRQIPPKR